MALVPLMMAQTAVRDGRTAPARDGRVVEVPLKKVDRDFIEKAAKAGLSEVQISRVAAARTQNPEVKRFAQMIIEEHEKANEQLVALAAARNFGLPAKDPHPTKWEKHDARSFDKEYVNQMVADHEDVVKLFEKQANNGDDAETVAFARRNLPKMQKHLQHALDLKRAMTDKR